MIDPEPNESARFEICSFCGQLRGYVDKLVSGPGVRICNECVDLCNEILEEGLPSWPWRRVTPPA